MSFADQYLSKQSLPIGSIKGNPAKDLKFIVIIPSFNESGLIKSLDSLYKASPISSSIEIIVNINWPETASQETVIQSQNIFEEASNWADKFSSQSKKFHIIKSPALKKKHAGVGLARKIAMDEAIFRFNSLDKSEGIICSFDADSLCDSNYFIKLEEHFLENPNSDGCSIYFEHPTSGDEFSERIYQGINQYELHLRYYLQAFRYSGHPHCFHTVGSSFAVKANSYCREGGMNRKKAGEDFYFLQKIFDLGNFSECNTTRVIPSPRPSDRVPFGTGKVISQFAESGMILNTYNFKLFRELKEFIEYILNKKTLENNLLDQLKDSTPPLISEYFKTIEFDQIIEEIISNSSNEKSFKKRFFRWFNMFRIMKFLNFGKSVYPDVSVTIASAELLSLKGISFGKEEEEEEAKDLLNIYRSLEREW